jgi:uncharacterized protein (DUF58 family)
MNEQSVSAGSGKISCRANQSLLGLLCISAFFVLLQTHLMLFFILLWLGVIATALLLGWLNLRSLSISIDPPAAAFAWEPMPIDVALHNFARHWVARDLILSHGVTGEHFSRPFGYRPGLPAYSTTDIQPQLKLPRRGSWSIYRFRFSSTFPLNLFRWQLELEVPTELLGLPRIGEIRKAELLLPNKGRSELGQPCGQEHGEEFYALRPWREGMSQRLVAWKASAKRGKLLVRENQALETPRVHVVLNVAPADSPNRRRRADFERAVSLAATMVEYLLRRHQPMRFSLLGASLETLRTEAGRAGFHHVLTSLADLRPDHQAEGRLPTELHGREATLVITAADLLLPAQWERQIKVFDVRQASVADHFHEARALPSRSRLVHLENL